MKKLSLEQKNKDGSLFMRLKSRSMIIVLHVFQKWWLKLRHGLNALDPELMSEVGAEITVGAGHLETGTGQF